MTITDRAQPKPNGSLDDLVRYADGIYLGEIERVEGGFLYGQPGSLLHVRVERAYRGSISPSAKHRYVFYPYLRAVVGDYAVCKSDLRFPAVPQTGDRVLVFAYGKPLDKAATFLVPEANEIFVESMNKLVTPRALRDKTGLAADALLVDLEQLVEARLLDPRWQSADDERP